MKPSTLKVLFAAFVLTLAPAAFCADTAGPSLKEASLVTEVLPWGETITALRLEYSDEIFSGELTAQMPSQTSDSSIVKFRLFADCSIAGAYVNNSGKKDDVEVFGKRVFINLGIQNMNATTCRSLVRAC